MEEDDNSNSSCKKLFRQTVSKNFSVKQLNNSFEEVKTLKNHSSIVLSKKSSYLAYESIFQEICDGYRSQSQLISQLYRKGINYIQKYGQKIQSKSLEEIKIDEIKNTKHFQIVILTVSLGPFKMILNIYNSFEFQIFRSSKLLYYQRFTKIYRFKRNNKYYIVKSTEFSINQNQNTAWKGKRFFEIVKEYCIGKIMSALKIGPRICDEFGFDLFVSEKEVFFFLESCQTHSVRSFNQDDALTLKRNLKEMHSLSILHRDIKPDNIMYSPSYEKYVFIDFGISEYRKKNYRELVFTSFAGTYAYSTKEMKKLFENHESKWVNLHLNDAYGLEVSLDQIENLSLVSHLIKQPDRQIYENIILEDYLAQVKMKFYFFMGQLDCQGNFDTFERIHPQFCVSIMKFLYEIPLTEDIRRIYRNYLEQQTKNFEQFDDLREIFQNRIFYESCKGKRKFNMIEQKNKVEQFQEFYQLFYNQHNSNIKLRRVSIKQLQQILMTQKINQLESNEYEFYVIEYLNFKRINPTISIEKKLEVCRKYLNYKNLKTQDQFQILTPSQIFESFFGHILLNMSSLQKVKRFDEYLRTLQNYFILTENMNLRILEEIYDTINQIEKTEGLSLIEKSQMTLVINLSFRFINLNSFKLQVHFHVNKIDELIKEKIDSYALKQKEISASDLHICEIYAVCLKYFSFELNISTKCDHQEMLEKLKQAKPSSCYSFQILNYIQYRILAQIEKSDSIYLQKKQKEEMILEGMENQNEINSILVHFLLLYYNNKQFKMLKKLLQIYDSCVQIQQIYIKDFIFIRFFTGLIALNEEKTYKNEEYIKKIARQILPFFEVKIQNIIIFNLQLQNFLFLYGNLQELKLPFHNLCIQMYDMISERTPLVLSIYESLDYSITTKGSKNLLYFDYLIRNMQIQYRNIIREKKQTFLQYQNQWQIYSLTKSFQKIINIDRSNFVEEDHIFVLFFDIIQIKQQKLPNTNRQILNYLTQRKKLITQMFSLERTQQKTCILSAFSLMLSQLNKKNNIDNIREGVDLVYPILSKKFKFQNLFFDLNKWMVESLIKLERFQQLLDEAISSSKFYTNHLSNSNTLELIQFYSCTIKKVIQLNKQEKFGAYFTEFCRKIDLNKVPIFSIFLLFCTRSFNRKQILKFVIQSLQHIKYNGRYFVLSRLYKEVLKLKQEKSIKKRRFLMRKDARYPSAYTRNLEEMKKHLNCETNLISFEGIFRQILQRKIITFGECCEVYSTKRHVHPLNQILNHSLLDND